MFENMTTIVLVHELTLISMLLWIWCDVTMDGVGFVTGCKVDRKIKYWIKFCCFYHGKEMRVSKVTLCVCKQCREASIDDTSLVIYPQWI